MAKQKIAPCLWFDSQAEEAARFYVSVFPDSSITNITPGPTGSPLVVSFQLAGNEFLALNGGPYFTFNEAISLSVDCQSQSEVDTLWETLCEGGEPSRCGWLKDKYGLSWQIVPSVVSQLMSGEDKASTGRVMQALMGMGKIDIQALQHAAADQG